MKRQDIKVGQTLLRICGMHIKVEKVNTGISGIILKTGANDIDFNVGDYWGIMACENYVILKNNTQIYEIF